jgi:hypothetical protein
VKRLAIWALLVAAIVSLARSPIARFFDKISGTVVRSEHPGPEREHPGNGSGG